MASITILLFSCMEHQKKNEMYEMKGVPDSDQSFSYMYFKNEKEGYLFGTFSHYLNLEKTIENPDLPPEIEYEANIYKTIDGGHNWEKIYSDLDNKRNITYSDIVLHKGEDIYIVGTSLYNYGVYIDLFSMGKDEILKQKKVTSSFCLFLKDDNQIGISTTDSKKKGMVITYDSNLNKQDSLYTEGFSFGINFSNILYVIDRDKNEGKLHFNELKNDGFRKEITLPIYPEYMLKKDSNHILLIGNNKKDDNVLSVVEYNIETRESKIVKGFQGYSIVNQFQSNEKKNIIVAFIGNISGSIVKYDLTYSLDNGKTWQIQKLEEGSYIEPSCLIGNVMYIYSGGARLQKIEFK